MNPAPKSATYDASTENPRRDCVARTLTNAQIERAIKKAFLLGEQWGCTYSDWFIPTNEDHERELRKATTKAKRTLGKK